MTETDYHSLLIVEASPSLSRCYEAYLCKENYTINKVSNGLDAISFIEQHTPKLVLLDLHLNDINGIDAIKQIRNLGLSTEFIIMTTSASAHDAVESMRAGAVDYLEKPIQRDQLRSIVKSAFENINQALQKVQQKLQSGHYCGFIGDSQEMQSVYHTIEAVAGSNATVFITGESGTGKEVCARAIHQQSPRHNNEFVALNCAAIPRELMESEIFGHVKGAFTGAQSNRDGAASHANGGTIFLDEIAEMEIELQSKLLRFIQTGTFQKVGSNSLEKVDIRFVCATNRDPQEQVRKGEFREDLYYRLHVVPIIIPPLRNRGKDILKIAQNFLTQYTIEEEKDFKIFSAETENILLNYHWPGNIRQLQNVVRNIIVLNNGQEVTPMMLPPPLDLATLKAEATLHSSNDQNSLNHSQLHSTNSENSSPELNSIQHFLAGKYEAHSSDPFSTATPVTTMNNKAHDTNAPVIKALWLVEMETIEHAIRACGDNIPKAAKCLDISPSTIYRKRQIWKKNYPEFFNSETK